VAKIDRSLKDYLYVDYKITVPAGTEVKAGSGSGDIDLIGPLEEVKVGTGSGDVKLTNITGGAKVSTGSGDVTCQKVENFLEVSTGSGDIRGRKIAAGLKISTASGDIEISLTEAGGDISATTASGEIDLKNVKGGVTASTASGDITITGVPNSEWSIKSVSGDIDLRIVDEVGFSVDAKTWSGEVETDHPITISGRIKDNVIRGDVRGGGALVYLRSTSGDISIR
jgi:DUF4097 and DUF4098 domain-containing protein YvlB